MHTGRLPEPIMLHWGNALAHTNCLQLPLSHTDSLAYSCAALASSCCKQKVCFSFGGKRRLLRGRNVKQCARSRECNCFHARPTHLPFTIGEKS